MIVVTTQTSMDCTSVELTTAEVWGGTTSTQLYIATHTSGRKWSWGRSKELYTFIATVLIYIGTSYRYYAHTKVPFIIVLWIWTQLSHSLHVHHQVLYASTNIFFSAFPNAITLLQYTYISILREMLKFINADIFDKSNNWIILYNAQECSVTALYVQ